MQDVNELHYRTVISALTNGRVVPFLGAGANLCDRPDGAAFEEHGPYLPSGSELAAYLARSFGCPPSEDLARVAQYIALVGGGTGALYQALRLLFDVNYPPTLIHKLLAVLPRALRDAGHPPRYQLIVTTNYDDVLERTFHAARQEFDIVSYVAEGEQRGKFLHWSYVFEPKPRREDQDPLDYQRQVELDREEFWELWPPRVEPRPKLIEIPNEYSGVSIDRRPTILKLHGAVDRISPPEMIERLDSFVITDDDYIDYLTRSDIANLVPKNVAAKLGNSNFLFLGYSLRDWNLRVILRRIWGAQKLKWSSWAIQLEPEDLDQIFWMRRDIQILNAGLKNYITQLIALLGAERYIRELDERIEEIENRRQVRPLTIGGQV
jgi:hypothetical protein